MSRDTALVTADWVQEHLDDPDIVLIEVDEDTESYDKGHIRGAIKIDWTKDLKDGVRHDFISKERLEQELATALGGWRGTLVAFALAGLGSLVFWLVLIRPDPPEDRATGGAPS